MRYLGATLLLASAMALPLQEAKAQDPLATIVGGAIGAGVGAAATGGRAAGAIAGGVIGATAAAAITFQPRRGRLLLVRQSLLVSLPERRVSPRPARLLRLSEF